MATVSPAVFAVVAAGAVNAQRDSSQPQQSSVWLLFGPVGVPSSFGKHTVRLYVLRAVLRLAALVMCAVALGSRWFHITYTAGLGSVEAGPWYSTVCDLFACHTKMAWDDDQPALKAGQMAAIVCFLALTVTAIANRIVRRVALFRRLSKRLQGNGLLAEDNSGAVAAARNRALRVRSLHAYLLVDSLSTALALLGTLIFVGQAVVWVNGYSPPGMIGSVFTFTWDEGVQVAAGGCACMLLAQGITAAAALIERRKTHRLTVGGLAAQATSDDDPLPATSAQV